MNKLIKISIIGLTTASFFVSNLAIAATTANGGAGGAANHHPISSVKSKGMKTNPPQPESQSNKPGMPRG